MDQLVAGRGPLLPRPSAKALRRAALASGIAAALVAAVAALVPVAAQAATFQFAPKAAYKTGSAPEALAAGDLNGDGKPDIVSANAFESNVSVLINKGDGTFAEQVGYPTGAVPTGVAIADLNGDGKGDIVTADAAENKVSVLINKGDGTFEGKVDYPTGEEPIALAVADVNGDKNADIVTANAQGDTVSVLLGNGKGEFAAPKEFATGKGPVAVAIGDLNGDQSPDIVTANVEDNTVSVLLGNGKGEFAAAQGFTTGKGPVAVAIGDLNGDQSPDVVTANVEDNTVSVLLGNSKGEFAGKKDAEVGKAPTGVALADLNADGRPDIATADANSNTASVLLGKGDGTFAAKQDFATDSGPVALALADINGDGKPDIATANVAENTVTALLNTSVAALETSAGSLSFAPTLFGTKSASQKVTVTNGGSAVLTVNSVTVTVSGSATASKNFSASGCAGSSLAPGGSCSLSVTFGPKEYGSLKGEATIASSAGSKVIKLSGTGLPPAPTVTTGPATEIVGTYVTLTGTVISQGPGTFDFQYGPTAAYGSVTPTLPLASNTLAQQLTSTLSLVPGATYHYRLAATNLQATVNGADHVFTIPPEAPLVRVLKHGRLASVLRRGLKLRLSDTAHVVVKLKLVVGAGAARSAHLISKKSKSKKQVTVGSARVTLAANHGKTVRISFGAVARRKLAGLRRLTLTIKATPSTLGGVAGEAGRASTSLRR